MSDSWRDELVTKGKAADAARDVYKRNTTAAISAMMAIKDLPPSAQQLSCDGCRHDGMWCEELEMGYDCPCTRCIRHVRDNYEA